MKMLGKSLDLSDDSLAETGEKGSVPQNEVIELWERSQPIQRLKAQGRSLRFMLHAVGN